MSDASIITSAPMSPKPIQVENIPGQLRLLPNWIVWKYETRTNKDGTTKQTKVPYDAKDRNGNTKAKSNDPSTWARFDEAVATLAMPFFAGIGFCFPLDRSIFGLDFDAANELTETIIARLDTYVERSPSGKGYHAIALCGDKLTIVSQKWEADKYGCNMEIYNNNARYFTFTGNAVKNLPVKDCTEAIKGIIAQLEEPRRWEDMGRDPLEIARNAIAKILPDHEENDGSKRLLAWARQCAKAGLTKQQTVTVIREMEPTCPFPKPWNDYDIEKRLEQSARYLGLPVTSEVPAPASQPPAPLLAPAAPELMFTDWDTVHGDAEWLWEGKIPYEGCTLLAGEAGISKSTVALSLASAVSTGNAFPDGQDAPIGDTILFTAEDADRVVKSRLTRLGADLKRIHKVEGRKFNTKDGPKDKFFDLKDIGTIEAALKKWPETKLIIIDPVASYADGVDTHKNAEVRSVLKPLAALCQKHKLAVILVCHLNKDTTKNASDRITGSSAWRDMARACWFVVKDKQDETRRYLLPDKNNLAPLGNGFIYTLKDGNIDWAGETTTKLHELMRYEAPPSKSDKAEQWLKERLKDGKVAATELLKEGRNLGYSDFTVRQAKDTIGAKVVKVGFDGAWAWQLAGRDPDLNPFTDVDDRTF